MIFKVTLYPLMNMKLPWATAISIVSFPRFFTLGQNAQIIWCFLSYLGCNFFVNFHLLTYHIPFAKLCMIFTEYNMNLIQLWESITPPSIWHTIHCCQKHHDFSPFWTQRLVELFICRCYMKESGIYITTHCFDCLANIPSHSICKIVSKFWCDTVSKFPITSHKLFITFTSNIVISH